LEIVAEWHKLNMKNAIQMVLLTVLLLNFGPLAPSSVLANDAPDGTDSFWPAVTELVSRCSMQPYQTDSRGRRIVLNRVSTCPEIQVLENGAALEVEGFWYFGFMTESADSDGGDLFDVFVKDASDSIVAYRFNVPAFEDILVGLAGGDHAIASVNRQ
jgi:hypothetical protein